MGCCSSSNSQDSSTLLLKLCQCIETGTCKRLEYLLSLKAQENKSEFNINFLTVRSEEGYEINLIGYALLQGRTDMFKYLYEYHKASCVTMESYFHNCNTTGLHILCENNFTDLFQYYLKIHMELPKPAEKVKKTRRLKETIDLTDRETVQVVLPEEPEDLMTPIHIAVLSGHISIIKYALMLTESMPEIPKELDIHYIDPSTGNNCALLACKKGDYMMIKYLHSMCKANFRILNANSENAIQVLAAEAKVKNLPEFYPCLVYLIEKAKVNIAHNYQETIILLEYVKAVDYFLSELRKIGIECDKKIVEEEVLIKPPYRREKKGLDTGEDFQIDLMFPELKENETSTIKASDTSEEVSDSSFFKDQT